MIATFLLATIIVATLARSATRDAGTLSEAAIFQRVAAKLRTANIVVEMPRRDH
jgi:hypothetical protein